MFAFDFSPAELLAVSFLVIGSILAAYTAWQVGSRNFTERELMLMERLQDFMYSSIVKVANTEVDLSKYDEVIEKRAADGLMFIDARMLYVMDVADDWVSRRAGFTVDVIELEAIAERLYQDFKSEQ